MAKHKTTFDAVYSGMLLELNLGTNTGKSNMSGSITRQNPQSNVQTNPAGVQGGVDMKFAGNPKFAQPVTTVPGTTTQQAAVNKPQQQKPGVQTKNVTSNPTATQIDPKEMEEFTNLLSLRKTNPEQFNTDIQRIAKDRDPSKFGRLIAVLAPPK